jgi:hypothetical protein
MSHDLKLHGQLNAWRNNQARAGKTRRIVCVKGHEVVVIYKRRVGQAKQARGGVDSVF